MVPTVFMQLDEMPQTPNGKTDMKQLPEPVLVLENVKPENETELKLYELICEFTTSTEFGTTDDLYALGLTSLTLMKLNTLIYKEMNVNIDISVLFNNPTIKNLANEIKTNDNQDSYLQELIELSEEIEYYPLTENQLGVYYECMQNQDEIIYIIPSIITFDKSIDAYKLKRAVIDTVEAHPYLKTRIITTDNGEIKQKRDDGIAINEIEIVEVDSITAEEISENDVKAISLENNQLFAFKIYKTPDKTVLFSIFHHIITDGVSTDNFLNDLMSIYEDKAIEEETVNGYIYSLIEKDLQNSEKYDLSRAFFHDKLANEFESTVLTPNINGNPDDGRLMNISEVMDLDKITEFSMENSISKNVLVTASIILALNKFTFSDKTLITTIFNGRANPNYHNTQAFLVKTLPFIIDNENRQVTISEFLKLVNETWKDTVNHIEYPYTKIAEEFQLKPEFFYTYEESFSDDRDKGIKYEIEELNSADAIVTDYKVNFNVSDNGKDMIFNMEYNNQLYTEEYAHKFLDSVLYILNRFIVEDNDELRICDIALESEIESVEFSEVELPFIHKRFEKQVLETPDNVALVAHDSTLTYAELNENANRIANALIKMGVEPKSNVLVMLSRDSHLISAIMGVLKAGCAYVPIDMEYPMERIEYIYKNSRANYIITGENMGDSIDVKELLKENDASNPNVEISPDDLAYMIYTSGSTGNPKGVMVSHKNITNLFAESEDNIIYNAYSKMKKTLAITTISFDTFLLDFMSLTFGLEVVLADDSEVKNIGELTELIQKEQPDALTFTTPSRIRQYLEYDKFTDALSTFKYIAIGGEILPKDVVSKVLASADTDIFNIYGPTETTVTCNSVNVTSPDNITVGKALHNYVTDVRDIDGKLLPDGVMGELYIGGVGVSRGYHDLEEKTKEVFLTINGIPYYKSGDYAIKLPNGEFDVKGRIDNQIKLRGLRIEIGEIEANIAKFPQIMQNVVVIKEINNNEHLCAYMTADGEIDINLLKRYLKSKLTKYMIPTVFIQIDEMPQTPNGKTDIKRLPDPSLNFNHVEAESETEEKLVELVASITDTEEFGTTDDLYTLGFSSLTLMKLNSLIYQKMGVNLDITSIFTDPTIRNLADCIDNHIETVDVNEMIDLANEMEYFPLTTNQLGIYLECMQSPDEVKYTLPVCIRFSSNVDAEKLRDAVIATIEAHPYLKTRIINTEDGELKQKRCDDIAINEIEIVDVGDISNDELIKENVKAFRLTEDQLFRFKIYRTPSQTVLFSDFHHIITDGVSQDNIFTDITKAYNGENIEKEKIDGYTYSLIEEVNSKNEVSKKYFHNKLTQGIESTVLTPDLNGNPDDGKIKLVDENINSTFVKHFCQDHAISPNVLFMTTAIIALNKFTFSDKSLITTIFNGRANSDYFNTQGMLVKTIPIIINSENREMMIEDFIKLVGKTWKESLVHSSYPYTKLAEEYQLKPEFFYAFHEFFQSEEFTINNEKYMMNDLDGTIATDYKVNLNVYDDGEEINLVLEYNDQLYSKEYAKKFLQAMKFILVQFFVNDMDKYRICDVTLKDDFGLHEFSEVELPFIHKRFERQVDETPNGTALIASDATLTYGQLNEKANRIANAIMNLGIKPNSNVLIMLPRNTNLISAILGVLKAGCTFIPIDIGYPKGRIDYIFENSQADYIIADGSIENSIDVGELLKEENTSNPHVKISPDDLAYMIYTSGSTGNPKGVMTTHKNITNLFSKSEDSVLYNAYSNMHRTLALSTVSFDAFLLDFMTLTFGLEMVLANDSEIKSINELTALVKREKPDSLTFTAPSRFKQYLEYDEFAKLMPNFKYIGVGGEMVPHDLVAQLLENPNLEVFNIYGPTETTVTCNTHKILSADNITVGKALHNCITEVRDIDGKLLPDGIMGELYIGGNGVARGYYNMEEKTRESFITINDIPYYKSGDYAIEHPNGELVIKGRIDNQIKLRGLRIEIGEIESNISKYPGIKQNVVIIKEINNNEHLCAYFTAVKEIDKDNLKEFLTGYLTQYMIPTVFMQLDEMPISPNGKTDTKRLPEPKLELEYVAPQNELEQLICAIFSSTLGIETVGAEDNFFEIGGTSLVASKIILELLKRDYLVKYDDIFSNQTPRQLARFLSGENEVKDSDYDIADDYDYSNINMLLSENTFENFYVGEKQEIGNLLLTGVTGYLGVHVLYEYIKNEEGTVYCMLRKGRFDSCKDRLIDLFDYYFEEDLTDLIGSRIILSEGDITKLDDFKKLEKYPIDTLINCAAIVKHYTSDDYIFKVNVDGVINGIRYAQANNVRYVQVSTMSVLSYPQDIEYARDVQLDERTLYYRQDLTNKYVNSKFLAERMLLEAAVNGLDVKIVRVGNLMGRYRDGMFQKNYDTNAFLANIKSIKNIQAIPTSMYNEAEEMSPIDCTAKAIIALAKTPSKCRVFNCQNKNELHNSDIIDVLNSMGYDIREVSDNEFIEICRKNMDESIQGLITSDMNIGEEEFYDDETNYEYVLRTDQTVEILESLGFNWPKPDVYYLTRAMNYLKNLGFFN